jgi:type IV pilus assembly protein PilB
MQIADAELKKLLIDSGQVKEADLKSAWKEGSKTSLQEAVLKNNLINEKDLTILLAGHSGIPFAELANLKVPRDILFKIPERTARKYQAVLFGTDGNDLPQLAMADPDDFQAVDFISKELGVKPLVYIGTPTDISAVLDQYRGGLSGEIADSVSGSSEEKPAAATEEVSAKDLGEDAPIAKTVNVVLEYAVKSRASDVHIEPREDVVQVRYRIDGVLHETMTLPKNILSAVVSRIKILSNLKIDEHRVPQDGRFKFTMGQKMVSLRVSTLPVMDGEKVVMRLLDESTKAPTLDELGFYGRALASIGENLHKPHGLTLVTGPTGSGKSTTLYSLLTLLNTPGVNISTVEDPVEYRIAGVNQTQVNNVTGMTFANGLRALLRQDPNIIMVGEIRDGETADLAVQAALTGHVVLSTLHTNNAATSLPRLLDMGAEPFLIASTVNTVIGQRLVRRLCQSCRLEFIPEGEEITAIKRSFDLESGLKIASEIKDGKLTEAAADQPAEPEKSAGSKKTIKPINDKPGGKSILDEIAADPNIVDRPLKADPAVEPEAKAAEPPKPATHLKPGQFALYKAGPGCQTCGGLGYQSRIGIYEVLNVSQVIQRMIVGRATASEIQDQAVKDGMLTMQQDGFVKALMGLTTIEEVLRVTRE